MKLMKRAIAVLLCFLILTNGPISAFATEGISDNDVVVETTTTTPETEEVCEECGGSDTHTETCSLNIAAPLTVETTIETVSGNDSGCTECSSTEGHWETCSQYIAPVETCEHCGIELTEAAEHLDICLTLCTCEPVEGIHQEGCKFYIAPVETCEQCGIELTEGTVHLDTCLTLCTCEPVEGVHQEDCKFYVAPIGPQIGDKIWIKHDSYVYKSQFAENGYKLLLNYEVEIVSIITDENGNTVWYEFEPNDTLALSCSDYRYVQTENTSVEEPDEKEPSDEYACNCGETAPENIADHADSCPRKQYIKTLFEDKTAEEIYAEWGTYDEVLRADLLNMLQKWDAAKYKELSILIAGIDDSSGLDTVYIKYAGTAQNGISANISAQEGSFPEGCTLSVSDTTVTASEVCTVVGDEILGIVAVDITFSDGNPLNDVVVSLSVPAEKIPTGANKVIVVHMGTNGPEVVGKKNLNTADQGETIAFKTDSFSSYAVVFVNEKYNAQKMSSVLTNNSRYQITTFTVDLFDYDPVQINSALRGATSDGNGFLFTGYLEECSNNGINNPSSTHAKQGIMESSLLNGLPVVNFLNGANAGANTGKILFSDSYTASGKTIYRDIPFEFVYDTQTGYYQYNSVANHAQLNAQENRVELYADTLSIENNYVATIDLTTANKTHHFGSISTAGGTFKATTVREAGYDRMDPYVYFTVDRVNAAEVGQIYVKAKIPAGVGANGFQLFFIGDADTVWSEEKSFGHGTYSSAIPYHANGDWIEFIIDTNDNSRWTGTITDIRIDLFDSDKGTMNIDTPYTVEIAEIRFIRKGYEDFITYGGYYPFSEIQDSYPGNKPGFDYNAWVNLQDDLSMVRASRSIFNPVASSNELKYEELAFGSVTEFDFYLPVNKTGISGQDLTYYFKGDDDLWVFVDDQLVLDIGGGHGALSGNVNFTEGTWYVEKANTITGYATGADGAYGATSGTLHEALYSPGKHTMKIFYLERCGFVSNCLMKFNLPRTPQGSVVVSKTALEINGSSNSELSNADFEFQIKIQNNGSGDQNVIPLSNAEYYVLKPDGNTESGKTTDANGRFTLKSGQKAYFSVGENYKVTVTETQKDVGDYQCVSTKVNNTEGLESTQLTVAGTEIQFEFVNTFQIRYGNLTISKTGISDLDHNSKEAQSTLFTIVGTKDGEEIVRMDVAICGNDSVTILRLPIGDYTVTENTNWSWRYEPQSNSCSVTVVGGKTAETAFTNTRTDAYWLSGDCYAENWWGKFKDVAGN